MMGKTRQTDEKFITSETGNWNVADSFSKIKIMGPMIKCEMYEDIALNGHEDFVEELMHIGVPTDELKIRALKRLINELIRLAKNTKFAMKREKTQDQLEGIKKKLYKIRDHAFPLTFKKQSDQSVGAVYLRINKDIFDYTLEEVSKLKSDINLPLNRNHLIFTDREEFDPKAFKARMKDRMVNQG